MANDALLQVTGSAVGSPRETVTADGTGGMGYRYVGPNIMGYARLSLGGTFDRTSGDETLAFSVKIATDSAGTSPVTAGTSATQTENSRGLDSSETADSLGMVNNFVTVPFTTTSTRPYVGVTWDVSGTTPSAAGAVVDLVITGEASLRSGQ